MKRFLSALLVAVVIVGVLSPSLIAEAATKLTVTTDVLRVREKPSTSSKILGNVYKGNVYTSKGTSVTGIKSATNPVQVTYTRITSNHPRRNTRQRVRSIRRSERSTSEQVLERSIRSLRN
ncbi:hypothetical protein OVA29_10965 [Exiguobacterium sp. SL14]|nr:hypothetical protein [Exiguobacterium sp. SL14]MCY1691134.1 hypothetical protein [Exiguobacterium sp. SL14]